jgi:hypothetical protein
MTDYAIQPEDFRMMFEALWEENLGLRRELVMLTAVATRLHAEAAQLREIVAFISSQGERLAQEQAGIATEAPLGVDPEAAEVATAPV